MKKREGQKPRIDISVYNKKNKKSVCLIGSCQDFVSSKRIKMCRKLYKYGKVLSIRHLFFPTFTACF